MQKYSRNVPLSNGKIANYQYSFQKEAFAVNELDLADEITAVTGEKVGIINTKEDIKSLDLKSKIILAEMINALFMAKLDGKTNINIQTLITNLPIKDFDLVAKDCIACLNLKLNFIRGGESKEN